ncbi:hypothetical protein ODS41_08900 [Pyrobaculum sp. 3827-6]|uniref:hypothetical protein n=1 Tax=Pyrobaculum sp. 3827-6 TaxID=2983604 RepID=UPI0021D90AE8|nr:hypothetical protein [Pyrobaculum sp. 3827-6]MCU7788027.1 hypothetical protein [Pyrobaculum sp. 3827-6]
MIDIGAIVNSLIAQAPLAAIIIATIYYHLDKKIEKVDRKIERLEARIEAIRNELGNRIEAAKAELHSRIEASEAELHGTKTELGNKIEAVRAELDSKIETSKAHLAGKIDATKAELSGNIERARAELHGKIDSVKSELGELRRDLKSLADGFYSYQEILIRLLHTKNLITNSEAQVLYGALKALVPTAKSKYYTEEVKKRLEALLSKNLEDYTWDDVAEFEEIAEAIYNEYISTGREDLRKYYPKLRIFIAMIKAILTDKELKQTQPKP